MGEYQAACQPPVRCERWSEVMSKLPYLARAEHPHQLGVLPIVRVVDGRYSGLELLLTHQNTSIGVRRQRLASEPEEAIGGRQHEHERDKVVELDHG